MSRCVLMWIPKDVEQNERVERQVWSQHESVEDMYNELQKCRSVFGDSESFEEIYHIG